MSKIDKIGKLFEQRSRLLFFACLTVISLVPLISTFRFMSAVYGVPVDDAYIFFAYAKNIASGQGWSFNPGETSFGTSSVLWTLALVVPAMLKIDLVQASRFIGGIFYAASVTLIALIVWEIVRDRLIALLSGLVLSTTLSTTLIAVSGMDVSIHIFMLLSFTFLVARYGIQKPVVLGIMGGALYLSRPDAIIVIPILLASWLLVEISSRKNLSSLLNTARRYWLLVVSAALITVMPWGIFIFAHTGKLLQNSYYAKLYSMPGAPETLRYDLLERAGVAIRYAWNGIVWILTQNHVLISGILILIAMLSMVGRLLTMRHDGAQSSNRIMASLFIAALLVLLPLEYGWKDSWWYGGYLYRYILPVLPLAIILSAIGFYRVIEGLWNSRLSQKFAWLFGRSVVGLILIMALGEGLRFSKGLPSAIQNYRTESSWNEKYRRDIAEWLRANTPRDAHVAESFLGIGSIGYYAERYIVDGGGLADDTILSYWASDGDPAMSPIETNRYFADKGVSFLVGQPGLMESDVLPVAVFQNQEGSLLWAGANFDTAIVYAYGAECVNAWRDKTVFIAGRIGDLSVTREGSDEKQQGSGVVVALGSGWYGFESTSKARWAQTPAELIIYSPVPQTVELRLKPSLSMPDGTGHLINHGTILLTTNGVLPQRVAAKVGDQLRVNVSLRQKWNRIRLALEKGNFQPAELISGSADWRVLSFALSEIDIHVNPPPSR